MNSQAVRNAAVNAKLGSYPYSKSPTIPEQTLCIQERGSLLHVVKHTLSDSDRQLCAASARPASQLVTPLLPGYSTLTVTVSHLPPSL